jgi:hypothetical protein
MDIKLYGLLHLAENENNAVNTRANNYERQKYLYLKNAIALSKSLTTKGIPFTLLTNRPQEINDALADIEQGNHLKVESIECTYKIPSGIKFYSAHYKLDVFRFLASLEKERYVGLVDLDMIAISEVPKCLRDIVKNNIPVCYDISDQVIPAYGRVRIIEDVQKLDPTVAEGKWYGGEIIMGPPHFFKKLNDEINHIYGNYINSWGGLHHQGDEALTSVAIQRLQIKGEYIADGGTNGIIGRYWSICTLHPQKPFRHYLQNCFLLHLPSDKKFIASINYDIASHKDKFIWKYAIHRRRKKLLSIVSNIARKCR